MLCRRGPGTSSQAKTDDRNNGDGPTAETFTLQPFEEEFEEEERALKAFGGARSWRLDDGPFKLVLVVNMELKMGKGKVRKLDGQSPSGCGSNVRSPSFWPCWLDC